MLKIGKSTISQSATVQTTEQEAVSNQAQAAVINNAPTKVASSENTWQRSGLVQEGLKQKSILNEKLTTQESYGQQLEQVQKNKEAREVNGNSSLFGTIFRGPLIGTVVGSPIADKADHENKKDDLRRMIEKESEEIKKLEAELAEVYDSNFVATTNWFVGGDQGAEFQGESNVNQTTATELKAKSSFGSDDD